MAELHPLAEHGRGREVGRTGNHSDPYMRGGEATTISAKTDPAVGEPDDFDATIVPLPVRGAPDRPAPHRRHPRRVEMRTEDLDAPEGAVPIARITPRQQAKVAGRVRSIQVQLWSRIPTLELTIIDTDGDTLMCRVSRKAPNSWNSARNRRLCRGNGRLPLRRTLDAQPHLRDSPRWTYSRVRDHRAKPGPSGCHGDMARPLGDTLPAPVLAGSEHRNGTVRD